MKRIKIVDDGFKMYHFEDDDYLCLESDRMKDCIVYANKNEIKKFWLAKIEGFIDNNVDFLKDLTVEKLFINHYSLKKLNLDGLKYNSHAYKKLIIIHPHKGMIDLSNHINIEDLCLTISPNSISGLERLANLKKLRVIIAKFKDFKISDLGEFPKLEYLSIADSHLTNLKGIRNFPNLSLLNLIDMKSLITFGDVLIDLPYLTQLDIQNCKNIQIDDSWESHSVKTFNLNRCGNLPTINWLPKAFPKVEFVDITRTTILDGDMMPFTALKELQQVYITSKKNYNLDSDDINYAIANNIKILPKKTAVPLENKTNVLPTDDWEKSGITKMQVNAVNKALKLFEKDLGKAKNIKRQIEVFKNAVEELNQVNINHENFIDSLCREDLVDYLNEKAFKYGIDTGDDITFEWRNW